MTCVLLMQAVIWQVVDVNLQAIRLQFSADLAAFWDARSIYQAQLQAHQVVIVPFRHHTLLYRVGSAPTMLAGRTVDKTPCHRSFWL